MTRGEGRVNAHGVYEPDEVLTLDRDAKGWRGTPTAQIKIRDLGPYWIWATRYQLMQGDGAGGASPLTDRDGSFAQRAPDRTAAIDAASAYLRCRVAERAEAGSHDGRRIVAWLDTLHPAQADLFAGIAA